MESENTPISEIKRHLKGLGLKVSGTKKECEKRLYLYLDEAWKRESRAFMQTLTKDRLIDIINDLEKEITICRKRISEMSGDEATPMESV
jgi:hypothetical protein